MCTFGVQGAGKSTLLNALLQCRGFEGAPFATANTMEHTTLGVDAALVDDVMWFDVEGQDAFGDDGNLYDARVLVRLYLYVYASMNCSSHPSFHDAGAFVVVRICRRWWRRRHP